MEKIDELNLSARAYNVLRRAGITTIEELKSLSRDELIRIRNMSQKTLKEIIEKMEICTGENKGG